MSLELAIAFPVVLLLVTALMQYGLWYFARTVALAAAQEGVSVARVLDAAAADGAVRAAQYLEQNGADMLVDPSVVASSPAAGVVAIEVSGQSLSLIPGVALTVTQSAQGPVESFVDAGAPRARAISSDAGWARHVATQDRSRWNSRSWPGRCSSSWVC